MKALESELSIGCLNIENAAWVRQHGEPTLL